MKEFFKKYKPVWIFIIILAIIYTGIYIAGNMVEVGSPMWIISRMVRVDYKPITVVIPDVVLPSPNAFDTYRNSKYLLRHEIEVNDAWNNPKTPIADMQKYVNDNIPAINMIKKGLSQKYLHPPVYSTEDYEYSHYKKWMALSKIVLLDAQLKAKSGDWSGASKDALQVIQFGSGITYGADWVGGSNSFRHQRFGRLWLRKYADNMSKDELIDAIRSMEKIRKMQESTADMLTDEFYAEYRGDFNHEYTKIIYSDRFYFLNLGKFIVRRFLEVNHDSYILYMQESINNARLRYTDQKILSPPRNIFIMLLAPERRWINNTIDNQTQHEMLTIILALKAYHIDHQHYPKSLQELTPNYLSILSDDPYAKKGSYRYSLQKNAYLLYSVGPDSRDDNGKPLETGSLHSKDDIIYQGDILPEKMKIIKTKKLK